MNYHVAVLAGDGIGPEIASAACRVLDKVLAKFGHSVRYTQVLAGGCAIDATGHPLPELAVKQCLDSDAVLLGAVGGPKWDTLPGHLRPERALLGVRKVVFGSSGARNLPEGTTPAEGYRQVIDFVGEVVLPFLEAHRMVLAMEPIGHYEANFINTLDDGMRVVRGVNHPRVRLLADSVHVLYEGEDPHHLKDYAQHLEHIHVCEAERALPLGQVSEGLKRFLTILQATGYDKTLSFEPVPYALPEMRTALNTVKSYFI